MDLYQINKKLIGDVIPVGDASRDPERFENLKKMCDLAYSLICEIQGVSENANAYEYSVQRAGKYAKDYLENVIEISKNER